MRLSARVTMYGHKALFSDPRQSTTLHPPLRGRFGRHSLGARWLHCKQRSKRKQIFYCWYLFKTAPHSSSKRLRVYSTIRIAQEHAQSVPGSSLTVGRFPFILQAKRLRVSPYDSDRKSTPKACRGFVLVEGKRNQNKRSRCVTWR